MVFQEETQDKILELVQEALDFPNDFHHGFEKTQTENSSKDIIRKWPTTGKFMKLNRREAK